MRMTRCTAAIATALAAAALAAGCGGNSGGPAPSSGGDSGDSGGTTASGSANQTLTLNYDSQIVTGWDPSTTNSNEVIALQNIYDTLTRYDSAAQEVKPRLAESWTSANKGKRWTFKLRSGVKFQTGRPMTSADVKKSIERTIALGEGAHYIWDSVKTITTPDDTTVVFDLKYPAALDLIASAAYAAYVYDTTPAKGKKLHKWFEDGHAAGTGPYKLDEYKAGQEVEVRLSRFEDYWGGWEGEHYGNVVFRVGATAATNAQLLRSGEVSWVNQMGPQLWEAMSKAEGVTTTNNPSFQNLLAMLNTKSGPLADVRLRQALSYAMDYEGFAAALKGSLSVASGILPPSVWGHSDDLSAYAHDPEKAKQLLGEAGYGPGKKALKLKMTYTAGDAMEQTVASLMKSQLAQLNVTLDVQPLQWPTQWAKGKSEDVAKRQDVFLFYWWPDYADPGSWFTTAFKTEDPPFFNVSYYSNPTMDGQMEEAQRLAATDRQRAIDLYREMQQKLYEDAPMITLGDVQYQRALRKSVGNYVDDPAYPHVVFAHELKPQAG
jgi:peptide/nickel transport system substrate-binding protein